MKILCSYKHTILFLRQLFKKFLIKDIDIILNNSTVYANHFHSLVEKCQQCYLWQITDCLRLVSSVFSVFMGWAMESSCGFPLSKILSSCCPDHSVLFLSSNQCLSYGDCIDGGKVRRYRHFVYYSGTFRTLPSI